MGKRWKNYLERARALPLPTRQRLAFLWSAGLMLLVVVVWLLLAWFASPAAAGWLNGIFLRLRLGWEVLTSHWPF